MYHRLQWGELVDVMEASLKELPNALQQCGDECYGPLRLGRRMGFAQVLSDVVSLYNPKFLFMMHFIKDKSLILHSL